MVCNAGVISRLGKEALLVDSRQTMVRIFEADPRRKRLMLITAPTD
jgi:hypothetical protein